MPNSKHLVDIYGNPLSREELTSPQTDNAKLGHLHKHYAAHPSKGLTPSKLASVLLAAEHGDIIAQCELAEDMEEKDGHLFAELQKRRLCMKSVPWKLVPPRNASALELRDTEMLQEQLEDMTFLSDVLFDMSDGILKGFSNSEITWLNEEKLWLPTNIEFKDPSWFMTNSDNRNELRLRDNSVNGEALQPFGWVQHVHKTKSGYLARNGLARVLAWPYIFKNFSVRDFAEFNEIYGLPLRLGKYPTGANKAEINTLLRAVMAIGHNAGGVIPKGMDIEFSEAAKGSEKPFAYMMEFMEKTMSKAILGGTLTSQADGKSSTNALGNVHNEVRQELRDSDLNQIGGTLTRDLVLPMYIFNGKSYSKPSRSPRFEFDITESEDLKAFSDALPNLVDVGFKIPMRWVHEKLQIPEAQKDEPVLARSTTAPVGRDLSRQKKGEPQKADNPAALKKHQQNKQPLLPDQQAIEDLLNSIDNAEIQQQAEQVLQPIFDLINQQGVDGVLPYLAEAWPEMDDSKLQDYLARILFIAEVWGRINANA
jgi:phage gp29-like protein